MTGTSDLLLFKQIFFEHNPTTLICFITIGAWFDFAFDRTNDPVNYSTGNVEITHQINKYLLLLAKEQIRLAFEQSEKEVHDLRQRTREGLQTAKLAGKQIGQIQGQKLVTKKSIAAKEIIQKHNKAFGGSLNDAETIRQTGISKKTFYKYKKELLSSQSL